jgi:hypothetical protein
MEETAPFDGVMFRLEAQDDQGRQLSSQSIWDSKPWRRDWLKTALEDLQACRFQQFRDNFVRFNATPGTLAWDDDQGWTALAEKAGHCAWLMKQTGCKGLAIDFESYGAAQFQFDPARDRTFAEATRQARRRGAQFVRAVAQEFPDAVLLCLWLNSIHFQAGRSTQPESILAASHYGLLPAFIDGMLDALPPDMILVDGCENGYYMDSAEAYLASLARNAFLAGRLCPVGVAGEPCEVSPAGPGRIRLLPGYVPESGRQPLLLPASGRFASGKTRTEPGLRSGCSRRVRVDLRRTVPLVGTAARTCQIPWGKDGCGKKPCRGSREPLPTYAIRSRQPRANWPSFAKLVGWRIWPRIRSSVSPQVLGRNRCRQTSELGKMRRLPQGNSPGMRRLAMARGELRKSSGGASSRAWKCNLASGTPSKSPADPKATRRRRW